MNFEEYRGYDATGLAHLVASGEVSAAERYLLSRIDGRRDLADIALTAPFPELHALRLFEKLVESGIVKLSAG